MRDSGRRGEVFLGQATVLAQTAQRAAVVLRGRLDEPAGQRGLALTLRRNPHHHTSLGGLVAGRGEERIILPLGQDHEPLAGLGGDELGLHGFLLSTVNIAPMADGADIDPRFGFGKDDPVISDPKLGIRLPDELDHVAFAGLGVAAQLLRQTLLDGARELRKFSSRRRFVGDCLHGNDIAGLSLIVERLSLAGDVSAPTAAPCRAPDTPAPWPVCPHSADDTGKTAG